MAWNIEQRLQEDGTPIQTLKQKLPQIAAPPPPTPPPPAQIESESEF